jgi:SpoVK/Ycf46/Vps4 family AAA+-type ATPase
MITTLSLLRPDAFTYGVLATNKITGVLLYGPPGTGKTHLAKAVAKESGATMLEVSGADVLQDLVGEGEKVVRAIFSLARKLDPCIIFFDEAEGVFRSRSDEDRSYQRELLNQFLREWDGISKRKDGEGEGGFVMVSTNRPQDLDEAVLRRLPRRILVGVPTTQDREAILKICLHGETLGPDIDIPKIAQATPNYTGSDIKNMCVAAAFACLHEEIKAVTKIRQPGRPSVGLSLDKAKFPARRTLCARHFERAREEIPASMNASSMDLINKFHQKQGQPKNEKLGERVVKATVTAATKRTQLPTAFSSTDMDYFTKRAQEHLSP